MITRRCTQRKFLLRPDRVINSSFIYCLALAIERSGVEPIFSIACSNHHHTGILDVHGNFPVFLEYFHKLLAKCVNAHRGRWENVWSSEQTSVVELVDPDDVLDKMVYGLSNPAKDSLVKKAKEWPGFSSLPYNLGDGKVIAKRPSHFFRNEKKGGRMPATLSMTFIRPPGFENLTRQEFAQLLSERIATVEKDAAIERARTGKSVLGVERILAQHWDDSPTSHEPRRQMNPRVAAKNKRKRIETLKRNKVFIENYRAAREAYLRGEQVLFPPGTYWLAKFARVPCEVPS
jgi:hypothetical protein